MITLLVMLVIVTVILGGTFTLASRQIALGERKRAALAEAARAQAALATPWQAASAGLAATNKLPAPPRGHSRKQKGPTHE